MRSLLFLVLVGMPIACAPGRYRDNPWDPDGSGYPGLSVELQATDLGLVSNRRMVRLTWSGRGESNWLVQSLFASTGSDKPATALLSPVKGQRTATVLVASNDGVTHSFWIDASDAVQTASGKATVVVPPWLTGWTVANEGFSGSAALRCLNIPMGEGRSIRFTVTAPPVATFGTNLAGFTNWIAVSQSTGMMKWVVDVSNASGQKMTAPITGSMNGNFTGVANVNTVVGGTTLPGGPWIVTIHLTNFNDPDGTNRVVFDQFQFYGTNAGSPVAPYSFDAFTVSDLSGDLEH